MSFQKKMQIMNKFMLFLIITGFISVSGCVKDDSGFGGNEKITGKLIMQDTLSNGTIDVPDAWVYIGFNFMPNTVNYSYKTQTDKYGHFEISNLLESGKYQIYALKSFQMSSSQIVLSADTNIGNPKIDLELFLRPDKMVGYLSGVVMMHDSITNGTTTVASADVYLGYKFIPNTTHYTYKLNTDENGYFTSSLIPISDSLNYTFFVSKKITIGGNVITLSSINTFQAFRLKSNKIEILPSDSIGYITIKITDLFGMTPQPFVTWCLYSDPRPYNNEKPCEGSFYSSATNFSGLGYVSGLALNSKYYLKGYLAYSSDTLWVKDSLFISTIPYPVFTFKLE